MLERDLEGLKRMLCLPINRLLLSRLSRPWTACTKSNASCHNCARSSWAGDSILLNLWTA